MNARPRIRGKGATPLALSLMLVTTAPIGWLAREQAALYRDAETIYRATIARHPDSWLALTNLAVIELERTPALGVARLSDAIALNPGFAEAQFALGRGLQALGQVDGAIAAYREAARLRPRHAKTHDNLGAALASQNRLTEAEAEFRVALALAPGLAGTHTNLGNVLFIAGRIDEAIAEHREAIRLAPELGMAHANLGNALFKAGRFTAASAAYRDALRLLPELAAALQPLIARADRAAAGPAHP